MRHRVIILMLIFVALLACNNISEKTASQKDSIVIIPVDTISEQRTVVRKEAVVSHEQKVPDELNDWSFAVKLYETERRFHYIVRMQYKELRITDSINIPNLGKEPILKIEKDSNPYSCTIGFLDNKGNFKPYYRANVVKEQLGFKKIAGYGVSIVHRP